MGFYRPTSHTQSSTTQCHCPGPHPSPVSVCLPQNQKHHHTTALIPEEMDRRRGQPEQDPYHPLWSKGAAANGVPARTASSALRQWFFALALAVLLLLFLPPFYSRASALKRGWDFLNLALVVFAILCGLLGRNGGDEPEKPPPPPPLSPLYNRQQQQKLRPWYDDYGNGGGHEFANLAPGGGRGLRRSSSSYPDLREDSEEQCVSGRESRFSDDLGVIRRGRERSPEMGHVEDPGPKVIEVDTAPLRSQPSSPPRPPTPPSPPRREMRRRSTQRVPKTDIPDSSPVEVLTPPMPPPPTASTPPPPPPLPPPREEGKKRSRRRSSVGKDFASTLALFYQNRKNKRKSSQRARRSSDEFILPSPFIPPSPPPPPPPPPSPLPASNVVHQIFANKKERTKSRKVHSIPPLASTPPPPPPPPQRAPFPPPQAPPLSPELSTSRPPLPPDTSESRRSIRRTRTDPTSIPPPPLTPSPTLPPPPQHEENPMFCPSPDVNSKAEVFIATLREKWRLEKLSSMKEKHLRQQQGSSENVSPRGDSGATLDRRQQQH